MRSAHFGGTVHNSRILNKESNDGNYGGARKS